MIDPAFKGQDFYVPTFDVKVRNRALEQSVVRDITQVSYRDSLDSIDSFDITINNWDAQARTFKYSGSDLFVPGNDVELWMGYYSGKPALTRMIQGVIKKLTPSFPASGQPTLVITGLNQLDKLRKKQESHPYKNKTDSQIAKQIAGRLGVKIRTDAAAEGREEAHPYLAQRNEYDILFLLERARRIGYELSIDPSDPGQLYFGPSVNVRKVAYHLSYGKSLIQFQPNLDTSNQVAQVRVVGWDNNKQLIQATVTRGEIATRGVNCKALRDALEASFKDKEEVINDVPLGSQQEARTIARETLENIAKQMVTGSGSTVGLPGLRAGTVLMIDGLDECFGGRYFVTSTTHTIGDGGYTTQFECRREEI